MWCLLLHSPASVVSCTTELQTVFNQLAIAGDVDAQHCALQVQCQEKTLEAHKAGHLSDGLRSANAGALGM